MKIEPSAILLKLYDNTGTFCGEKETSQGNVKNNWGSVMVWGDVAAQNKIKQVIVCT